MDVTVIQQTFCGSEQVPYLHCLVEQFPKPFLVAIQYMGDESYGTTIFWVVLQ